MDRRLPISILMLFLFLCCASSIQAQQDTGSISGSVTDPKGEAVAGAQITITDESVGLTRTIVTNDKGLFTVNLLPVGSYTVTIEAAGFKKSEHRAVDLHVREEKILSTTL